MRQTGVKWDWGNLRLVHWVTKFLRFLFQKYAEGCTKFVGASGGNAGLALAYSAEKLGVPCQIFVPKNVLPRMLKRLKSYGTHVVVRKFTDFF